MSDSSTHRNDRSVLPNSGPWRREALATQGISSREIPGLYVAEDHGIADVSARLKAETKATYTHEEIFGQQAHLSEYIPVPVDVVYDYMANVYSLEEYTFSLRNFKHVGGGLYKGVEMLGKDTSIFIRVEAYPDSRVIDFPCAWDQGDELWMRYHVRLFDAYPLVRKRGTILTCSQTKHPYYDRAVTDVPEYISKAQARTDRAWVGDLWTHFDVIHRFEVDNLRKILTYRYERVGT